MARPRQEKKRDDHLHMRVGIEIIEVLDYVRKFENDLPSRSEMVRRLIMRRGEEIERGHRKPVKTK